jgi:PAS domain S-box-containing protein
MDTGKEAKCLLVRYTGQLPFDRCAPCDRTLGRCFVFRTTFFSLIIIMLAVVAVDQASPLARVALSLVILLLALMGLEINKETTKLIQSEQKTRELLEEREKLLKNAHETSDFLETLFDSVNEGIMVIDRENRIIRANDAAIHDLSLTVDDCIGMRCYEVSHDSDFPCEGPDDPCPLREVFNTGKPFSVTHTHYDKDGNSLYVEISATPLKDSNGEVIQVIEVMRDVTERKRAEDALAGEKELLSVTLRSIGDGVITADIDGNVIMLNKMAETLTGWSQDDAAGKPLEKVFEIVDEKTRQPCDSLVEKVISRGGIIELSKNSVLVSKDGTERIIADSGAPIRDWNSDIIGVVLVFRDVTEQRINEVEAAKAMKLESLGILAGGIAHDFNNLLAAVLGNVSLAKMYAAGNEKLVSRLDAVVKATSRARDLTGQLLTFSRGGEPVKSLVVVSDIIKDASEFAVRGSNVRCDIKLADGLWPIKADPGQISQVISNLIINADQAMPEGGVITVKGENEIIGIGDKLPLHPGNYIKISITDQGHGISEENLDRIFDPYFSTKRQGSGIGLATSYSIIKKHNGHIKAESINKQGATLHVYLPALPAGIPAAASGRPQLHTGGGRVLVMDDEEMVRDMVREQLILLGYEVEQAREGSEAVSLYEQAMKDNNPFDIVIMDLTIPGGMGGKDATREISAIDPDARIIVSSGYAQDPILADYQSYGFKSILIKPYRIEELGKVVHELMREK